MNIVLLLGIAVVITAASATDDDPASHQLWKFKDSTHGHIGALTTRSGAPVEESDTKTWINPNLLENEHFMDMMLHLPLEKVPERITHTKGAGAFGYFEVTHNLTDICKAKVFNYNGKRTPVAARFSPSFALKGEPDTLVEPRALALKFYTPDGNLDLLTFNTPVFTHNDPQKFPHVLKVFGRNPVTNLKDSNMMWDYIAHTPESVFILMHLFGDDGIPDGYRHMSAHSLHTYQVYNENGESYFLRWSFFPECGIKSLTTKEGTEISYDDRDYAVRDLYNEIEKGNYPSWILKVQVLTMKDVQNCKFNPFDLTKTLFEDEYPYRTVGKLVLNRNPTNYFRDVEQIVFCPSHLVPGIMGAPDLTFQARRFMYKAAHRHRCGTNFDNIKVNQPLNKVLTYTRDGVPPIDNNSEGAPNYYPNSFNGPEPYVDENKPKMIKINHEDDSYNFEQPTRWYNELSSDQRQRLYKNFAESLSLASKDVQERVLNVFKLVHPGLALGIMSALT